MELNPFKVFQNGACTVASPGRDQDLRLAGSRTDIEEASPKASNSRSTNRPFGRADARLRINSRVRGFLRGQMRQSDG